MQFEVLMDQRENPHKCTVHPLRGRAGLEIRYFGKKPLISALKAQVLLHVDGQEFPKLTASGPIYSLAVIDCVWKKVESTLKRIERPLPTLARIPEGFTTAYPRRNKQGQDPEAGLATIEAMFIAAAFCGEWDLGLLEKYHFGQEFIQKNLPLWQKYGLGPYAK